MVSEEYRKVEDSVGKALMLNETLIQEISYKMHGSDKTSTQDAIYRASVACGHPVLTIAHIVNEFLVAYHEHGREELRLETCAMCDERYKQEASRWHVYQKSSDEKYIFCSYEHLDQWAKEHKEWVYHNE